MNPRSDILKLHPYTIDVVRKEINLAGKGEIGQAVNILKEWIAMQPHFRKKDFPHSYLETCIVTSKGSIERAKLRLDKMCTMRTLLPHFFDNITQKDFEELHKLVYLIICPKLTRDNIRVFISKGIHNPTEPKHFTLFYKYVIYIAEFERQFDYCSGFRIVYDMRSLDLLKFVKMMDIVELRQALSILMAGYGMRIMGIHLITQSKAVKTLINIAKQILKPKIADRLMVHRSLEELHDIIDTEVLPVDYEGLEKSVREINDDWVKVLFSKDNMDYIREMNEAVTDESLRPIYQFNEEYAGLSGSFRILKLD